jgi:hypothetical protein
MTFMAYTHSGFIACILAEPLRHNGVRGKAGEVGCCEPGHCTDR